MSDDFATTYTRAGLAEIRSAEADGLQAEITAIAIGRGQASGGGYVGYAPTGTETALKNPIASSAILSAVPFGGAAGTGGIGFSLTSLFGRLAEGAPAARIREVGVFLSTGTLLCLWSDPGPDRALGELNPLAALVLDFDLYLTGLDASGITVTVQETPAPENLAALFQLLRGVARNGTREIDARHRLARLGIRS